MRTEARVVVIGGGVVGASVLYHLTRAGWTDVMLVERSELTHGSTWHSAGGMHTLNGDPNVAKLQQYTIELYKEIEEVSGQDCGIHVTGGVMLADTPERMDWLRLSHARGRYLGMETELISVAEAKELMPLLEEQYFVGAMYDAHEGHVDPSGVTNAYAIAARAAGAEIHRKTWARSIRRAPDGGWLVDLMRTEGDRLGEAGEDLGTVHCDHVVNAGGLWAREVGRMVGLELPVLAMEHMYLLTEDLPAVAEYNATHGEVLHCIDFGGEIYMRQEGGGLLLGTYEQGGVPWSPRTTPWEFGQRLLAPDLDRIAESLDVGFRHFPVFAEAGIKTVINGPFTFSPDGNPLLGPIRGLPGYWSACAVMAGLSQGGGVGLALANWMIDGDPGFDVWGMDVARYGDFATLGYTDEKVRENYGRRFRITFPNEELPAARPLQTSPIHDRLTEANAVWGASFGLEVPLWFQEPGLEPIEEITFGRSNAWDAVRGEAEAVRTAVGLSETTAFSKFAFDGPGARALLDRLVTNIVPRPGRMALAPMVNHEGRLIGDLTIACVGPATGAALGPAETPTAGATANTDDGERFFVFGSGVAERYYERWFDEQRREHLAAGGAPCVVRTLGYDMCGLSIAGPRSRDVLASLTDDAVGPDEFGFMAFRRLDLGPIPVWCGRVTFTGDLGYEFWMPSSYQRLAFDLLVEAGRPHGMRLFGGRALDALRLEKSFGSWAREYRPLYTPFEAQLGPFVKLDHPSKGPFVGRDALARLQAEGPERQLVTFVVDTDPGRDGADVIGDEPVWHCPNGASDGEVVGWVTSGGYAHMSDASVALAYVPSDLVETDGHFQIEVLGVRRRAELRRRPLFDAAGERMRG